MESIHHATSATMTKDRIWRVVCLQDYYGGAEGGAIFNKGDIIVDGAAEFTGNRGGVRANTPAGSVAKSYPLLNEADKGVLSVGVEQPNAHKQRQTLSNSLALPSRYKICYEVPEVVS